jgi:D-alanine-D-alanine ligase
VSFASAENAAQLLREFVDVDLFDVGNSGAFLPVDQSHEPTRMYEDLAFDPSAFRSRLLVDVRERMRRRDYLAALLFMHGGPGEDGTVAQVLQAAGLGLFPASAATLRVASNKRLTSELLESAGVELLPYRTITLQGLERSGWNLDHFLRGLDTKVVIKPDCTGSSIGVAGPGTRHEDFQDTIPLWRSLRSDLIVQNFLPGPEYTCGFVRFNEVPTALHVVRKEKEDAVLSFSSKYGNDPSYRKFAVPADAPVARSIHAQVKRVAELLPDLAWFRADFLEEGSRVFLIDVNPIPSFSAESTLCRSMITQGISPASFLAETVSRFAQARGSWDDRVPC